MNLLPLNSSLSKDGSFERENSERLEIPDEETSKVFKFYKFILGSFSNVSSLSPKIFNISSLDKVDLLIFDKSLIFAEYKFI